MNRRQLLKLGMLGGAAGAASMLWPGASRQGHAYHLSYPSGPSSPALTPFQVALPIPPVLTPYANTASEERYRIEMRVNQVQIFPGYPPTTVWGYEGMFPGPTIMARTGRATYVTQVNNLGTFHPDGHPVQPTVHQHGGRVQDIHDGHPNILIPPGGSYEYFYPNIQDAATLWYHDHEAHHTATNVYRGLAGFYLVQDDVELALGLPSGDYDVPIAIMDKLFRSDGSFYYPALNQNSLQSGFFGDTLLANGAPWPYFQVARRKYRFRFLNASNAREYQLALSSGQSFIQVGSDQGLLPAPVNRSSMIIVPSERLDVVIDFSIYPIGSQIVLKNTFGSGRTAQIMRFDVVRDESDDSVVPPTLRPIQPLTGAVRTRYWDLSFNGTNWTLNGRTYDVNRFDAFPALDSTEIWVYRNFSQHPHPMHPHLVRFQVLRRFPGTVQPYEGWKDTIRVKNGEEVHVIIKFTGFRGAYVHHCHNLEHEDHDMMTQFKVV